MTAFKKRGEKQWGKKIQKKNPLHHSLGLIQYATQFALECVSTVD